MYALFWQFQRDHQQRKYKNTPHCWLLILLSHFWDGHDLMVVGFTTTYAIGAYHHWSCEFESRLERDVQHFVIKFFSDLQQVGGFLRVLRFPPPIKLPPRYSWNIVESGVKHHPTNKYFRDDFKGTKLLRVLITINYKY